MENKFGLIKHGISIAVDLNNSYDHELFMKIDNHFSSISEYLVTSAVYLKQNNNKANLPCKACLLDIALQCRDLGSLIEELANGK